MLAYVNANFEAIKTKFIGLIQAADFCYKLMRSMAVMLKIKRDQSIEFGMVGNFFTK